MDWILSKTPVVCPFPDQGLCALEFEKEDRNKLLRRRLSTYFSDRQMKETENKFIAEAELWLSRYFSGTFDKLFDIKQDLRGTEFEKKVWNELLNIPLGETISYSQMVRRIGNDRASRAVGGASRRNPMSIIIPCHRVVGANGKLTGYGGGLDRKEMLIRHEKNAALVRVYRG